MNADAKTGYHHGDLQAALLRAARALLEEEGIAALKLRAITRRAGVSATAATPHFGNLTGLLSALATEGYDELAAAMSPDHAVATSSGTGAGDRKAATCIARDAGRAYIRFAVANPGLFTLMFRGDAIDWSDARLTAASARAFARLADLPYGADTLHEATPAGAMAARWGKVHGLAILAIDGLLAPLTRLGPAPLTLEALIDAALS